MCATMLTSRRGLLVSLALLCAAALPAPGTALAGPETCAGDDTRDVADDERARQTMAEAERWAKQQEDKELGLDGMGPWQISLDGIDAVLKQPPR
jgi:hypothetical protein